MAMFLLDIGLKTGTWVLSGAYYGVRYLIYGHEETEMEKVEKQVSALSEKMEALTKRLAAPPHEELIV